MRHRSKVLENVEIRETSIKQTKNWRCQKLRSIRLIVYNALRLQSVVEYIK